MHGVSSTLQDGSWSMDDLHLVKLNQQLVQNILVKAGAKSLGVCVCVCVWVCV